MGIGDLDLYVRYSDKDEFEQALIKNSFCNVKSYQAHHNHIEHYLGFDSETKKFVHIHVYFKIVTGESNTKNYELPLDRFIEENLVNENILPVINNRASICIFLVRYFIKIGSIYGLIQYMREKDKYVSEWRLLNKDNCNNLISIPEMNIFDYDFKRMLDMYESSHIFFKYIESLKFKFKIRRFINRGFFSHQTFKIKNFFHRLINKILLKRKKSLNEGKVISICGLDGTGKSTLVDSLENTFNEYINIKKIHLGRPRSTMLTFLFKPFFQLRFLLIGFKNKRNIKNKSNTNISLIYALRSIILAYDRKIESIRAQKYKKRGYLVISDRYPGLEESKMDSPRIKNDPSRNIIYNLCYKIEQNIYNSIPKSDILFHLEVPLKIAIQRNDNRSKFGKESTDEIVDRYSINSEAKFLGIKYFQIDAKPNAETVLHNVLEKIWLYGICDVKE
tara:strand:- start:1132 stop:2475 length:1344 start_codon:yes stop_codon:yes gene_type:complete